MILFFISKNFSHQIDDLTFIKNQLFADFSVNRIEFSYLNSIRFPKKADHI